MKKWLGVLFFNLLAVSLFGQTMVRGYVYNQQNKDPLPQANISINDSIGTITNLNGFFELKSLKPGLYTINVSYTGFQQKAIHQVRTSTSAPVNLSIELVPAVNSLTEVVVTSESFKRTDETPLALNNLSQLEVQTIPGAVMDVSKAIQSLPGVLPRVSFGYSINIRGGASNENRFFLDGIEIPAINHFNVMGATGGPNGLLNFDLLRNSTLYSSAFPAEYSNALSGVLELQQREGRSDRFGGKFIVGYTDYGAVLEGPLGKNANYMLSYRKSFSEYYLKAFNVPVLPAYSDFQFRTKWNIDDKNELIVTGVGGFDQYRLNTDAPTSDALLYNTGYIPEGDQSLYAVGVNYKHYLQNSFYNVIVSRNSFLSVAEKFRNNSGVEADRLLSYNAEETDNRFRFEHKLFFDNLNIKYGVNLDQSIVDLENYALTVNQFGVDTSNIDTRNSFLRYGLFGTYSNRFFKERLSMSLGFRIDAADLNSHMQNPLNQFSPRLALNYMLNENWNISANSGIYYQLPPNIVIGFYDENDPQSELKYMRSVHYGAGVEYQKGSNFKASLEGFYKIYSQYPFLLNDSISYANAFADYVVVGNQPTSSINNGRTYGAEFMMQQKLKKGYWWMLSYTYSVSEFEDKNGNFRPSSWDARNSLVASAGKRWKNNWQLGIRWRYVDGTPYTPYDLQTSGNIQAWNIVNRGVFDYDRLNEERIPAFHSLDVRVDKHFFYEKWNLSVYLDIQNFYNASIELLPYLTVQRDDNFAPIVDPNDNSRYLVDLINSDTGRVLPTFGIVAEF